MNNAPVAWREKYWGADVGDQYEFHTSNPTNNPNWIPLYTHPAKTEDEITIPKNSQDWKGMDGATVWHLIFRHANGWSDIRMIMEEWLKANTHPAKTLTDEGLVLSILAFIDNRRFTLPDDLIKDIKKEFGVKEIDDE